MTPVAPNWCKFWCKRTRIARGTFVGSGRAFCTAWPRMRPGASIPCRTARCVAQKSIRPGGVERAQPVADAGTPPGRCRFTIDNYVAERAVRPLAVGRKNGQFIGGDGVLPSAAVLMSLCAPDTRRRRRRPYRRSPKTATREREWRERRGGSTCVAPQEMRRRYATAWPASTMRSLRAGRGRAPLADCGSSPTGRRTSQT